MDERDIRDVYPEDVKKYTQCHFFAGIGGWPLVLELSGFGHEEKAWTGSCPCQPFSAAGKRKGAGDERHLWPDWYWLIRQCRPSIVFGEQVASKAGREWLSGVRADMEALGHAFGAADLCAAGAGAPHIRQRLFWVAQPHDGIGSEECQDTRGRGEGSSEEGVGERLGRGCSQRPERLANDFGAGLEGLQEQQARAQRETTQRSGLSFWGDFDVVPCADGKARRVEPGTFPLAYGVSARVGKLRAYGNAIVPQVAAEFVTAWMDCRP